MELYEGIKLREEDHSKLWKMLEEPKPVPKPSLWEKVIQKWRFYKEMGFLYFTLTFLQVLLVLIIIANVLNIVSIVHRGILGD